MKNAILSLGSVGIIGGADGPTAVFVTGPDGGWKYAVFAAAMLVAVVMIILHRKRK